MKILKNRAFTLAEVIITLGIIGVVAAMTIPTLIQKYQEKEMVSRWFKAYSMLQQVIKLAEADCGNSSTWTWENFLDTDKTDIDVTGSAYACMKPYLKVVSDCPKGGADCFLTGSRSYSYLDKSNVLGICNYYGPAVKLISGETICFHNGERENLVVDLNGTAPPNRIGIDVHYFSLVDTSTGQSLVPGLGGKWSDRGDSAEGCNMEFAQWRKNGDSCGFWIQRHKNMKYLHMTKAQVQKAWNSYK